MKWKRLVGLVLAAAIAAGAGFYAGNFLGHGVAGQAGALRDIIAFLVAGGCGALAYLVVVVGFRRSLPLGGARL